MVRFGLAWMRSDRTLGRRRRTGATVSTFWRRTRNSWILRTMADTAYHCFWTDCKHKLRAALASTRGNSSNVIWDTFSRCWRSSSHSSSNFSIDLWIMSFHEMKWLSWWELVLSVIVVAVVVEERSLESDRSTSILDTASLWRSAVTWLLWDSVVAAFCAVRSDCLRCHSRRQVMVLCTGLGFLLLLLKYYLYKI